MCEFNLNALPHIAEQRIAVHVKPAAERALRAGHPWVYDQAIRKQSHQGQAGDLAVIFDKKRRFLAIGLYDPDSPIRVKVLQHRQQATINRSWFADKLQNAATIRLPLLNVETNGYRLVHGENDGLPALILDRYADTLVLKLYSAAWLPHLRDIITVLPQIQTHERLVLRLSRNMTSAAEQYGLRDGLVVYGGTPTAAVQFQENGLTFTADVIHGHKTGFFFDQRENRAAVRELAKDRTVLDVFAYNGGFSVYAAAGGAKSVTSLDISAPALDAAQSNFALNRTLIGDTPHQIIVDDAFKGLEKLQQSNQSFDMVIVDPPSFAKSAGEIDGALATYQRLVELALPLVCADGIFVMASCSSRVTGDTFFQTVLRTAHQIGQPLTEIKRTGHALDHPIGFPEGAYLKCLFAHPNR